MDPTGRLRKLGCVTSILQTSLFTRALARVAVVWVSIVLAVATAAQPPAAPEPLTDEEKSRLQAFIGALVNPETSEAAALAIGQFGPRVAGPLAQAVEREYNNSNFGLARQLQALLAEHAPFVLAKLRMGFAPDETLILFADYSENAIVAVDDQGRERWRLDEVFGAWDAELTPSGNVLVTEFSVSRVREIDPRTEATVWEYEGLKNPYDADALPNGNVLIANTFAGSVIEVNRAGDVVWRFNNRQRVRAFDVDRLPNGHTLVADVVGDRVIEVDPKGVIVGEIPNCENVHDADRLVNGSTAMVLRTRNCLQVHAPDGSVATVVGDLASPSDADQLSDGSWIVAENGGVRRFDADGKQLWHHASTWVVEVNVY